MHVKAWPAAQASQKELGCVVLAPIPMRLGLVTRNAHEYDDNWIATARLAYTVCCCCVCRVDFKAWVVAQILPTILGLLFLIQWAQKHGVHRAETVLGLALLGLRERHAAVHVVFVMGMSKLVLSLKYCERYWGLMLFQLGHCW